MKSDLEELNNNYMKKVKEFEVAQKSNDELKINIQNKNKEINELNNHINEYKVEIDNLSQKVVNDNKDKICELEKENEKIKNENNLIINEQTKLKDEMNKILKNNKDFFKENIKLKEDLELINSENKLLKDENKKLKNEILSSSSAINKDENDINLKEKELILEQKNKEIENLQNIVREIKEEKSNLVQENKNLKQKIDNSFDEMKLNYENKIKTLNEQIDQLKKDMNTINNNSNSNSNLSKKEKTLNINMNINDDEILKLKDSIENKKYFNDENNENNISLDDRDNKSDIVNLSVEEKIIKSMITLTESSKIKDKENESEEISKLKNEIRIKDNIISKMKEEISVLSQTQIIEHRTIVDDEEFNELVDENEELKKMNKELIEKLNEYNNNSTRTRTDINKEDNLIENDNGINANNEKQSQIISQQKQELELLRTRFEQLYRELNQYRQKNSDLNIEIKKLKDQSFNDSKSIYSMNDELTINKMKKSYNDEIEKLAFKLSNIEDENTKLKELLKQSGNELNNKSVKIDIINEEDEESIKNEKDED